MKNLTNYVTVWIFLLSIQNSLAQAAAASTNSTKGKLQTEVMIGKLPTPDQILAKHNITSLDTASSVQLQALVDDVSEILKTLTIKEERAPYLRLKSNAKGQLPVTLLIEEWKQLDEKLKETDDKLKETDEKLKETEEEADKARAVRILATQKADKAEQEAKKIRAQRIQVEKEAALAKKLADALK